MNIRVFLAFSQERGPRLTVRAVAPRLAAWPASSIRWRVASVPPEALESDPAREPCSGSYSGYCDAPGKPAARMSIPSLASLSGLALAVALTAAWDTFIGYEFFRFIEFVL